MLFFFWFNLSPFAPKICYFDLKLTVIEIKWLCMVHTYYSFTISYGRYAINDPMTSFAAADKCDLCRNTIFVEHGTEQWKQLRDAQEMPKGWMWQEKIKDCSGQLWPLARRRIYISRPFLVTSTTTQYMNYLCHQILQCVCLFIFLSHLTFYNFTHLCLLRPFEHASMGRWISEQQDICVVIPSLLLFAWHFNSDMFFCSLPLRITQPELITYNRSIRIDGKAAQEWAGQYKNPEHWDHYEKCGETTIQFVSVKCNTHWV